MAKLNFKVPAFKTPYDIARSYLAAGVPVFPCREESTEGVDYNTGEVVNFMEKAPYTSNGLLGATRNERIVRIWWQERHPNAAIGAPTGEPLGAWVLDIDKHGDRDGHAWLTEMIAKHGDMPATARATTANGGLHIMFKHVPGVRNRAAIAPGVDTRGSGGYILAPGSVMADGRKYEWIDHEDIGLPEFADAPQWLLDLVVAKEPISTPRRDYVYQPGGNEPYVERAVALEAEKAASAPAGSRGQQLYASACALGEFVAAGALSRSDAEAELYRAASHSGVLAKDGERATIDRIRRGLDKTKGSPREIPERQSDNDNMDPRYAEIAKRVVDNGLKKKAAATQQSPTQPSPEPDSQQSQPKKRERFERTWFDEIQESEPKETFIKGVLGTREFTTISGLPGTGKSVIVTDMACHVATGREWHGKRVKPGLVIYVAAERKKLTERRMMAFRKEHDVVDVPLLVIGGRLDLTRNLDDAKALIAEIKNAEIETGQACIWLIIDTLTRVFGAGDQNASKDMTKFVQSVDEILMETNAHVTAIHHSAWSGERGKGAIDLDGAVDASFMVKKSGGSYKLICDGTNDGEEGEVLSFTMKSVELGVDEDGEPTTAPVVLKVAGEAAVKGMVENATRSQKLLYLLSDLMDEVGVESPGMHGMPEDTKVVPYDTWRIAFYETMPDAMQHTRQSTFKKLANKLEGDGKVGHVGEFCWVLK